MKEFKKIDHPYILEYKTYTMLICQAKIQQGPRKGLICGNHTDVTYCSKHMRHSLIEKSQKENVRYCDIARGCFTILDDSQKKCNHCLHKARIGDRKRNMAKRQDVNLCLECSNRMTEDTRAKGKHNRPLRRCISCYQKLLKQESKRPPRCRNYKAEAFTNKHVAWNHYVKGAKKRHIDFTLSKVQFEHYLIQPCFYCLYQESGHINGIDRVDNNIGYVLDNVVTCCEICNILKGSQHPQEWIDKMKAIYDYHTYGHQVAANLVDKWRKTYLSKYSPRFISYSKNAITRNLEFKLSEDQFREIINHSCYLCGLSSSDLNKNGIDRLNNLIGYVFENCKPCCGHCNLMKRDISFDTLIEQTKSIVQQYTILSDYFTSKIISIRLSKIEPRTKIENPIIQDTIPISYKPENEIIIPRDPITSDIISMIEKSIEATTPRQWKANRIFETIQQNKENEYKIYCELSNDLSNHPNWESDWITFVLAIKDQSLSVATPIIKSFIENLRRIRHNTHILSKNLNPIDRDNREQWPSRTVVRAFLEGKIDIFKQFIEEKSNENKDDPGWICKWNMFIKQLEEIKEKPSQMNVIVSRFLTNQRIKRYRNSKNKSK